MKGAEFRASALNKISNKIKIINKILIYQTETRTTWNKMKNEKKFIAIS